MKLSKRLLTLFVALLVGSFAGAQALEELLPAETIFALGAQDLEGVSDHLDDFLAEWERLEVGKALTALFAEGSEEPEGETQDAEAVLEPFEELDAMDFLGQDAWLAVSASSFNPLPAFTLLARVSQEALPQVQASLEEAVQEAGTEIQELSEGAYTFYVAPLEEPDEVLQVIAYTVVDDLIMVSTNPDVLRGVLRRLGGADDGFTTTAEYAATLGSLDAGNFYTFLSYAKLQAAASPFTEGLGLDALVSRLSDLFATASAVGSVSRLMPDGVVSESVQLLDVTGGDAAFHALLTQREPASLDTVAFVPADALSYTAAHTDLSGWWQYLNSLAASVPELGGDLDTLISSFFGISLQDAVFSWTGTQASVITTDAGPVAQPGMPSENLLGESVYLIETTDEAAARTGLAQLFQTMSTMLAAFGDPTGGMGSASMTETDVGGVTVTSFAITPGVTISYAVTDGYALIATSDAAMQAVLNAQQQGPSLSSEEAFTSRVAMVPDDAASLTYSDAGATMDAAAEQLATQVQTVVGLGGASQLDFDETTQATETLEQFLQFVASRLGSSISYTVVEDDSLYTYGETDVDW